MLEPLDGSDPNLVLTDDTCLRRVAAAAAAEVAEAPAELIGSPEAVNVDSISSLSPGAGGLPARLPATFGQLSYSKQYDHLFATMPLDVKKPVPKPDPLAQQVHMWEAVF
jgi:hypothetical protein